MPSEDREFERGQERGLAGESDRYGAMESFASDLFDSASEKSARRRGFESGKHARAVGDEVAKNQRQARGSSGQHTFSYGGTSFSVNTSTLLIGGPIYLGLVLGAITLLEMEAVAEGSLVWWLCILVGLAGLPLAFALLAVGICVMIVYGVFTFIVGVLKYFIQNPY